MWVEDGVEGRSMNATRVAHFRVQLPHAVSAFVWMAVTEVINLCFPGKPHFFFYASPAKLAFFSPDFILLKENPSSRRQQTHL